MNDAVCSHLDTIEFIDVNRRAADDLGDQD